MDKLDELYELVEVQDCPLCDGPGLLEEECGNSFYVMCMDCGAHTVNIDFMKAEDRLSAAKRAAHLWNIGKVLSHHPGE